MQNGNTWLSRLVQENLMQIIVFVISFTIAWTLLSARLSTVEAQADENTIRTAELQTLVERIIVLEERDNTTEGNILDIKEDIRDIKNFLNVPIK